VSLVVMVVMVVMMPLVRTASGYRGQQTSVAPDPGPVASGRRAIHAHVDADRAQRFRRGSGAAAVTICENIVNFPLYIILQRDLSIDVFDHFEPLMSKGKSSYPY